MGKLALLTPVVKYEKMHQFKMNPAIYSKHSNNFSRLLNVTINVNVCNELVCHFLSKQVILTNLSAYGNEGLWLLGNYTPISKIFFQKLFKPSEQTKHEQVLKLVTVMELWLLLKDYAIVKNKVEGQQGEGRRGYICVYEILSDIRLQI